MALEPGEYQFCCKLENGYRDNDVKGICVCSGPVIATSSEFTVRLWSWEQGRRYTLWKTLVSDRIDYEGELAWIPPNDRFPEGAIVSGGRRYTDYRIEGPHGLVWDLSCNKVVESMRDNFRWVTGIVIDDNGDIITSSRDCTLKRWRKGEMVESWEAHQMPVLSVVKLPTGEIVTGSSDSSIKIWRGQACLQTLVGHTDVVRDLAVMPGLGILSASHDHSIRLWSFTGQLLMEMIGHSSVVYSVDAHSSGLVASGGEDCFLKIWKDGVCIQSIEHPGYVYKVKFLENGDIVTICSMAVARIWTSSSSRVARSSELEYYANDLSLYKIYMRKDFKSYGPRKDWPAMRFRFKAIDLPAELTVPDNTFVICTSFKCKHLSLTVNELLKQRHDTNEKEYKETKFDFIIYGKFLRTSLYDFLGTRTGITAGVVEIHYILEGQSA